MANNDKLWSLIGVPAVIALVVSVVRLAGELQGGPQGLFGTAAGGGGSLVGIAWLVPIFGLYFGLRLARDGRGPSSIGKAAGLAFGGLLAVMVLGIGSTLIFDPNGPGPILVGAFISSPLAIYIARMGWSELANVLMYYGFASRLPVVLIMFFALRGAWGTHYDALPPTYQSSGWFMDWILVGVVPQLTIWIAFTVVVGMLFGAIGAVIGSRKAAPAAA